MDKERYEKPVMLTFDEREALEEAEMESLTSPPPSAWSCVRG